MGSGRSDARWSSPKREIRPSQQDWRRRIWCAASCVPPPPLAWRLSLMLTIFYISSDSRWARLGGAILFEISLSRISACIHSLFPLSLAPWCSFGACLTSPQWQTPYNDIISRPFVSDALHAAGLDERSYTARASSSRQLAFLFASLLSRCLRMFPAKNRDNTSLYVADDDK